MSISLPKHIAELKPYKPGRPIDEVMKEYGLSHVVKLASNENPLGPSPKAIEEIMKSVHHIELYPNGGNSLRDALAEEYTLAPEEVIVGSGSEGVMNTLMRTFLVQGDEVITSAGTFGGFYVLANAMGLALVTTPMKDYAYDLNAIAEAVTPRTKLIYLANPNNPTGSVFGKSEFEKFYAHIPKNVIVVLDEAYCDFAGDVPDYFTLVDACRENVLTLRTFSKSHGLAGIRIGFATGPREIIAPMLKVKLPFEPSGPAQAGGLGALRDKEFLAKTIETNDLGKIFFTNLFTELGLPFIPTAANFFCLTLSSAEFASQFVHEMERHGVIVRPLAGFGLADCVRVSIGTPEQNQIAAYAMTAVLEEMHYTVPA